MPKAVGIDLGTTNSVVSVLEAGEPIVIPNAEGGGRGPAAFGLFVGLRVLGLVWCGFAGCRSVPRGLALPWRALAGAPVPRVWVVAAS